MVVKRYLWPLGSVTKPSLSDPSFFLSNRPKNGSSFLYKIGLKSGFFYKLVLNI